VSLLILPAIINLEDNNPARYTIAGVALVVVLVAVGFSKRKAPGLLATEEQVAAASVHEVTAGG
jgi:hypothetical protein